MVLVDDWNASPFEVKQAELGGHGIAPGRARIWRFRTNQVAAVCAFEEGVQGEAEGGGFESSWPQGTVGDEVLQRQDEVNVDRPNQGGTRGEEML